MMMSMKRCLPWQNVACKTDKYSKIVQMRNKKWSVQVRKKPV